MKRQPSNEIFLSQRSVTEIAMSRLRAGLLLSSVSLMALAEAQTVLNGSFEENRWEAGVRNDFSSKEGVSQWELTDGFGGGGYAEQYGGKMSQPVDGAQWMELDRNESQAGGYEFSTWVVDLKPEQKYTLTFAYFNPESNGEVVIIDREKFELVQSKIEQNEKGGLLWSLAAYNFVASEEKVRLSIVGGAQPHLYLDHFVVSLTSENDVKNNESGASESGVGDAASAVPEPTTGILALLAMATMACRRRR